MRVKPVAAVAVVFLLLAVAPAQTFETLFTFRDKAKSGSSPVNTGSLALDGSGNLYVTAYDGGTLRGGKPGAGTVFQLSSSGKKTVLYTFGSPQDGANPYGAVALDASAQNIYGTTVYGGSCGFGTVFRLSKSGSVWKETILHSFCDKPDGSSPYAGLLLNPGKRECCYMYGTTQLGGAYGAGTVFGISGLGKYQLIHSFCQVACKDGDLPQGGLILDTSGNLYGMTSGGGTHSAGTVFRIAQSGSKWTETVLYNFCSLSGCADGESPQYASLTFKADGTIFGVTYVGGASNNGTVFQLAHTGSNWTETVLYSFQGGNADGAQPKGTLAMDSTGNLWGTTDEGGPGPCNKLGCGTVFELAFENGGWSEKVLYDFQGNGDGTYPESGLALDKSSGKLYGVTTQTMQNCDQQIGCGVIYDVHP
jgi:uncharacterized repeat protein (TIGR03803 family)